MIHARGRGWRRVRCGFGSSCSCGRRWLLAFSIAGMMACGGEADVPSEPPAADLDAPSSDYSDEDLPDLDLGAQMELALVEYPAAVARLETQLPNLTGYERAQLEAAITEIGSLLAQLRDLLDRWSSANAAEREELAPEVEAMLDELDASMIRAESLLGPETT